MKKYSLSPQQMNFSIEGERFFIPSSLLDQPYGQKLTIALKNNSLFKEKPEGDSVLLIDLTNETPQFSLYNPNNWQKQNQKPEYLINPLYSTIIIVASQIICFDEFQQLINENKKRLNLNGGEIFVFETDVKNLNREELNFLRQEREKFLRELGFIKYKVSPIADDKKKSSTKEILTQARLKKIAKHHPHEIDLLTPRVNDPPWKEKWRKGIIPKIIKMYKQAGFTEVDVSEIEYVLKHSTTPPKDLAKARDGFDIFAKASCGCCIKLSLDATFTLINNCRNHPNGIPQENIFPKKPSIVYKIGETELKRYCGDCGISLIQSARRIKSYPNGQISLQIEIFCPHCGLVSTEKKYVFNN